MRSASRKWHRSACIAVLVASLGGPLASDASADTSTQGAVEYVHSQWHYYFVTSSIDEIVLLDNGGFGGVWQRTGQVFDVWPASVGGSFPTCRFFSASFAPKSSHFYTPYASECSSLKSGKDWTYEGTAFFASLPDGYGNCPAGTMPLYRAYNQGMGGAPNHRFTTSLSTAQQMQSIGWVPEGNGPNATFACVPPPLPTARAEPVIMFPALAGGNHLPAADTGWSLRYRFIVPPLPTSPTWDATRDTFYVWGDVDFDAYGRNGAWPISGYVFNQIVPQAFIGQVLAGNDANYLPLWKSLSRWAIQAQYYWYSGTQSFAQTGSIVEVNPGQEIETVIGYDAATGKITATISAANGSSSIVIDRPFPNEPALFANWTDYFRRAQQKSSLPYVVSNPVVAVEPYSDRQTLCSVLPFRPTMAQLPNTASIATNYRVATGSSGFSCAQPPVLFSFH